MLAKGDRSMSFLLSFFLLLLTSNNSYAFPIQINWGKYQLPTLYPNCRFAEFQYKTMPKERGQYRGFIDGIYVHNVALNEKYDRDLTAQITSCYRSFITKEFGGCDLNKIKTDRSVFPFPSQHRNEVIDFNLLGNGMIDGNWHMPIHILYQGTSAVKREYFIAMHDWLEKCFTEENIKKLQPHNFKALAEQMREKHRTVGLYDIEMGSFPEIDIDCGSKGACNANIKISFKSLNVTASYQWGADSSCENTKEYCDYEINIIQKNTK
jgi:hypothetical protein